MKTKFWTVLAIVLITCSSVCAYQFFCKTQDGREVILDSNGTWEYSSKKNYKKSSDATKFVKSKKIPFGVWIDPEVWKIDSKKNNEDAEFEFSLKNGDAYAVMINEGVGFNYDFMKRVVADNLSKVLENVSLVKEEERTVNGLPITYFHFEGSLDGVFFNYFAYVYIGEDETIQLIGISIGKNFEKYKPDIEIFLNGLSRSS